jgi:hypothetical protein
MDLVSTSHSALRRDISREDNRRATGKWTLQARARSFLRDSLFDSSSAVLYRVAGQTCDTLRRRGVLTLGQLLVLTDPQLSSLFGADGDARSRVLDALKKHGYTLRPERCPIPPKLQKFQARTPQAKLLDQWLSYTEIAELAGVPLADIEPELDRGILPSLAIRPHRGPLSYRRAKWKTDSTGSTPPTTPQRQGLAALYPPPSSIDDQPAVTDWYRNVVLHYMQHKGCQRGTAIRHASDRFKHVFGVRPLADLRDAAGFAPTPRPGLAARIPPPEDRESEVEAARWFRRIFDAIIAKSGHHSHPTTAALTLYRSVYGHNPSPRVRELAGLPLFGSRSEPQKPSPTRTVSYGLAARIAIVLQDGSLTSGELVDRVSRYGTWSTAHIRGYARRMIHAGEILQSGELLSLPTHRLARRTG